MEGGRRSLFYHPKGTILEEFLFITRQGGVSGLALSSQYKLLWLMEVARAWARDTTRPNTSAACLAITLTSARSLLPVSPSMTAPMTGWGEREIMLTANWWSLENIAHLQPVSVRLLSGRLWGHDGQEDLQSDVDDVPPGERILSIEINPVHSVSLTGPGLPRDDSNQERHDLGGELHGGGQQAGLLLGCGFKCSIIDGIAEVLGGGTELPGKFLRGEPELY